MAQETSVLRLRPRYSKPTEEAFHKFTELPNEIQNAIWEHALFDPSRVNEMPGIHFFNSYPMPEDGARTWTYLKHHTAIERQHNGYGYYAPEMDCGRHGYGWGYTHPGRSNFAIPESKENDSAYLTNAAL